jgi:hypothetical protein
MAEDPEAKKDQLKKQLALVGVNITNAINQLNNGKVVSPGAIEEMYSQRAKLQAEIKRLEEGSEEREGADPSPLAHSPEPEVEEYGIPSHLRIARRPYTISQAALKQREKAANSPKKSESMKGNKNAWKTGEYAQGLVRQIFRPCKSTCPRYPCALVEENETEPGDICLDKIEFVRGLQAVQTALKDGKIEDFKELAAVRIAGGMEVPSAMISPLRRNRCPHPAGIP